MDKYFFAIITLIIFSIIFIIYVRLSVKDSKVITGGVRDTEGDSVRYDNVSKSKFIPNDPLSHLKTSNHPTASDFTLLE